jgi:hypothetical protein
MGIAIGVVVIGGVVIFWGADIGRAIGLLDEKKANQPPAELPTSTSGVSGAT